MKQNRIASSNVDIICFLDLFACMSLMGRIEADLTVD